jgi:hypothetical protein
MLSNEEIDKKRIISLATLLETGAKYKTNKNGHKYVVLTEEQQNDIEEEYAIDCIFMNYITKLQILVDALILRPANNRQNLKEETWPGEYITITGKQQCDRDKQKADNIIWEFGESEASLSCKQKFKLKIYDIICKAEKHNIILKYGNSNPTDVKSYFKKLKNKK